MKLNHGPSDENWKAIRKDEKFVPSTPDIGIDWNTKTIHFPGGPDSAKSCGAAVLEIEYDGEVIQMNGEHSQATFEELPISKVRRMTDDEVAEWVPPLGDCY